MQIRASNGATTRFNPWRGCVKISAGCAHCYAETLSHRNPTVLGIWGDHGTRVIASESAWREPLKWDKAARNAGERHRVFCASLADVFEDRPELVAPRVRLFHLIQETPNLDWLLLTKRPENVTRFLGGQGVPRSWAEPMPPNIWAGTSVENRKHGLPRMEVLKGIPSAVRFLSVEPLLEDLGDIDLTGIAWVICGGESGPGARPMHPIWVRRLRDQCVAQGVAFFFKQHGEWLNIGDMPLELMRKVDSFKQIAMLPSGKTDGIDRADCDAEATLPALICRVGKKAAGRELDGRTWDQFPVEART